MRHISRNGFGRTAAGVTIIQNGAAGLAAMAGGTLQFVFASLLQVIQAHVRGVKFQIVAPGQPYDTEAPTVALLVKSNSPLKSAADLNGKTIASPSLHDPLDDGKVVATVPIGEGVDANAFDPETNFAFASTGDGHLTIAHEDGPDRYTTVATVPTKKSARTMGLDLKTHRIFLPAADFDAPAQGERRGKMKPGSFVVLVVSRD